MNTSEPITTTSYIVCQQLYLPTTIYGNLPRTNITQEDLAEYPLSLADFVVHNAPSSKLPAAGANDDLGCVRAAFGTNSITLKSKDLKGLTADANYGATVFHMPVEYVDGETVQIVVSGKMDTTVAGTSAVVDVEAYKVDGDGAVGADLCLTAAQSINSLTKADKTFVLNATGLAAGDILEIRVGITATDAVNSTSVYGVITKAVVQCDIKG